MFDDAKHGFGRTDPKQSLGSGTTGVLHEFLAMCGVAELTRVREGGEELNSGEFSYCQESLPDPTTGKVFSDAKKRR